MKKSYTFKWEPDELTYLAFLAVVKEDGASSNSEWLFRMINKFCLYTAVPVLESHSEKVRKIEKNVKVFDEAIGGLLLQNSADSYISKLRTSSYVWTLLLESLMSDDTTYDSWLIEEIAALAQWISLNVDFESPKPQVLSKTITISEVDFKQSTNLKILRRYAKLHGTSVQAIIQNYIIGPKVKAVELSWGQRNGLNFS